VKLSALRAWATVEAVLGLENIIKLESCRVSIAPLSKFRSTDNHDPQKSRKTRRIMASISGLIVTWVILVCVSSVVAQGTSLVEAAKKDGAKSSSMDLLMKRRLDFPAKTFILGHVSRGLAKLHYNEQ
jgi:hypothetical protein